MILLTKENFFPCGMLEKICLAHILLAPREQTVQCTAQLSHTETRSDDSSDFLTNLTSCQAWKEQWSVWWLYWLE